MEDICVVEAVEAEHLTFVGIDLKPVAAVFNCLLALPANHS